MEQHSSTVGSLELKDNIADEIRTPQWYLLAYSYLSERYPKKYNQVIHIEMEGMYSSFVLKDLKTNKNIGPIIVSNNVRCSLSFAYNTNGSPYGG